jgi:HlyD family secretion protein
MPKPKSKVRRRVFVLVGVVLLAGTIGTTVYLRKREVAIPVQTEKVTRRNLTEVVVANGRVQPVLQVKISPEVSGEIIELPVKEGQNVKKGDLLLKINPDVYIANQRSAQAGFDSAISGKALAEANLRRAQAEFKRNKELFSNQLVSESTFVDAQTSLEVAQANADSAKHQIDVAKATLDRTAEELSKTTIYSPLTGTVSKLNSELGERVVGTAMMTGTEVMTIADLNEMEARVDIGEVDVVLIARGQVARLEVEAFRDRKFSGVVTEIANSSKGLGAGTSTTSQEATKFEVKIRIKEKEVFRPGMSVTAYVETRYRTNVLCVPIQSVTTRLPKKQEPKFTNTKTTLVADSSSANRGSARSVSDASKSDPSKKSGDSVKPIEVVFTVEGDRAVMLPVKRGISDDSYMEILEGIREGQEVVSGGYKAINRDLEEGKRVKPGPAKGSPSEEKSSA